MYEVWCVRPAPTCRRPARCGTGILPVPIHGQDGRATTRGQRRGCSTPSGRYVCRRVQGASSRCTSSHGIARNAVSSTRSEAGEDNSPHRDSKRLRRRGPPLLHRDLHPDFALSFHGRWHNRALPGLTINLQGHLIAFPFARHGNVVSHASE